MKCVTFNVMSQMITVLDASAMRCMASAISEMAAELQHDEQACHESMLGELSYSLSGMDSSPGASLTSHHRCSPGASLTSHHRCTPGGQFSKLSLRSITSWGQSTTSLEHTRRQLGSKSSGSASPCGVSSNLSSLNARSSHWFLPTCLLGVHPLDYSVKNYVSKILLGLSPYEPLKFWDRSVVTELRTSCPT